MSTIPQVTSGDIDRIVRRDFPASLYDSVTAILNQYKEAVKTNGVYRVRLAALKVADGDIEKLRTTIQTANVDFRDVITEAEYPTIFQIGFPRESIDKSEKQRIEQEDWEQYEKWLHPE